MNGHNINNSCSQCNNGTNHMNTTNERFDEQFNCPGCDKPHLPHGLDPVQLKTFISQEKNLLLDQAIEVVEQRAEFEAANEYTQGRHQMAIEILACLKELKE